MIKRGSKLGSMPLGQLVCMVRAWMAGDITGVDVKKITAAAAAKGSDECAWLLKKMEPLNIRELPTVGWMYRTMENEDCPWGWYYFGQASLIYYHDDGNGLYYLRKSAEAGFTPAMNALAFWLQNEESSQWIIKSAKLNDPQGLYRYSNYQAAKGAFDTLLRSANLGNIFAMGRLASQKLAHLLSPIEIQTFFARQICCSGYNKFLIVNEQKHEEFKFVIGRELEGYEEFWEKGTHPIDFHKRCIKFYLDQIQRMRRAALQTVFGLRRILGRDVAVMIGKMVYESRNE